MPSMTEETIIKHIRELNKGNDEYIDPIEDISSTVELMKLYEKPFSEIMNTNEKEYFSTVYFIKDDFGIYVGGVHNGGWTDLHWVILPEYRKMGYLTKAMKEYILPHILREREVQRITIDGGWIGKENFTASSKVALVLGFIEFFHSDHISYYELKAKEYVLPNN